MLWRAGFHPGPRVTIQLQGPVPPGLRDAAEGVLPSDAVERVPPRPDGVAAVPPIGGTSALRSIRWDNIRWGRQVPLCLRSGTATTRPTSGCGWTWPMGASGPTSTMLWAKSSPASGTGRMGLRWRGNNSSMGLMTSATARWPGGRGPERLEPAGEPLRRQRAEPVHEPDGAGVCGRGGWLHWRPSRCM
jgi:hypothetical protein